MVRVILTLIIGLTIIANNLQAQDRPEPEIPELPELNYETVDYNLHSGVHTARENQVSTSSVYNRIIHEEEAQWLRLYFDNYELGDNSYLMIRAEQDESWQKLDSESLSHGQGSSAYFNGGSVNVELYIHPDEKRQIYFELTELKIGKSTNENMNNENSGLESLFSDNIDECTVGENDSTCDNRTFSDRKAVGRIDGACTGFISSHGAIITAAHCVKDGDPWVTTDGHFREMIHFNVPNSNYPPDFDFDNPDHGDQFPHANHQYYLDSTKVEFFKGFLTLQKDWAVHSAHPNSNTGKTPIQAQQSFYRLVKDDQVNLNPSTELNTVGYGVDDTPSGPNRFYGSVHCLNDRHKSQQIAQGNYSHESGDYGLRHDIVTAAGESGGPLEHNDYQNLALGVQSTGYSSPSDTLYVLCESGTHRFTKPDFSGAIDDYRDEQAVYLDAYYYFQYRDDGADQGSYFNPHSNLNNALSNVSQGGLVSIVEGSYASSGITIDQAVTIEATGGKVVIGGSGTSSKMAGRTESLESIEPDSPEEFHLENNYPNPFNPVTTIEYTLPEEVHVELVIYDILGRRVETLINEPQQHGTHQATWDASNMASGTYIYRLDVTNPEGDGNSEFTETRQMMLVK